MWHYPVLIPTLNRYDHLKRCIDSLRNNTHAGKTELVIILDYPPSEKYEQGWKKIKQYLPTVDGFGKITIIERERNYFFTGELCADIEKMMLDKYGAIICTEDDNVFSPNFLDYMNKCLEYYEDDEDIVGISGYTPPIKMDQYNVSVFKHWDPKPWGFGVWKAKEEIVRKELSKNYMNVICESKDKLKRFENNIAPLYALRQWSENSESLPLTCDIYRYCYNIANDKYTIHPLQSLVRNEGHDGSGVHCGDIDEYNYSKQKIQAKLYFEDISNNRETENSEIIKIIDEFFFNSVINNIQQYKEAETMYKYFMEYGLEKGNEYLKKYIKDKEVINNCCKKKYKEIDELFALIGKNNAQKNLLKEKLSNKRLVLFGKGIYGKKSYLFFRDELKINDIIIWDTIPGMCDFGNNLKAEKPIKRNNQNGFFIVVTAVKYYSEIKDQLEELMYFEYEYCSIYELLKNIYIQ